MNKRAFIKLASMAVASASIGAYSFSRYSKVRDPFLFSSSKMGNGFYLSVSSKNAYILHQHKLPGRGHDSVFHPFKEELITVARRPGDWFSILDIRNERNPHLIKAGKNRHFYGHGVFSPDGRYLFMTENDYSKGEGVIGIYDSQHNYQKLSELSSYGIGPHQLKLLSDGKTIVVANGGIRTHPNLLRKKLNLEKMQSSLSYINSHSGELIDQVQPVEQRSSIRHLDIATNDSIVVGIQYQRDKLNDKAFRPLVAFHHQGQELKYAEVNKSHWGHYNDYTGSVCCHHSTDTVCISSPRGNIASIWDITSRQLIQKLTLKDVCGVGQEEQNFILTTGHGDIITLDARSASITQKLNTKQLRWDNHLLLRNV